MPGPSWDNDSHADELVIAANMVTLLSQIVADAPQRRAPDLTQAHDWHREIYRGVSSVPAQHYLGNVRGGSVPALSDYEVVLVDHNGRIFAQAVPAAQVSGQLAVFIHSMAAALTALDQVIAAGKHPTSNDQLYAVLELAGLAHGEWIRIHPYANGNGRTARTWANWVAVRYGLPPFIRITPRPDGLLYGQAAGLSMGKPPAFVGDHRLTVQVFLDLLRSAP